MVLVQSPFLLSQEDKEGEKLKLNASVYSRKLSVAKDFSCKIMLRVLTLDSQRELVADRFALAV